MSEFLHQGAEQIAYPNKDIIAFPVLAFHFSQSEIGNSPFDINNGNSRYIAELLTREMVNALHHSRALVFGGPFLRDALLLQRTSDGVIALHKEKQDDASSVTTSWQYSEDPAIAVSFDGEGKLNISIENRENPETPHSVHIVALPEDGLMVFTGKLDHKLENRYEHSGGISSLSVVDKERDQIRYSAVQKLIEETDASLERGETRKTYYEFVSDVGDITVYREMRPQATTVQVETHLTNRKCLLIPNKDWMYLPH